MLIKVFPHGKGSATAAVDYLIRDDYFGRGEKPPEVIRGDPELTKVLSNSIEKKWKFTSGVCSWSAEDGVSLEQQIEVMDNFEKVAFAGLDHDQHNILWVQHTHTNRCELHFIIPRIELSTGKAFNAFPPNWQKDFDPLRDYENIKHGWTRPDDPKRTRMFTKNNTDIIESRLTRWGQNPTKQKKESAREVINEYIKDQIISGIVTNRGEIINALRDIGLEINRESKSFITAKDPESNEKIRLKGGVYESGWRSTELGGETQKEGKRGTQRDREDTERELAGLEQKLSSIIAKRARYNRKRYQDWYRGSNREPEPIPLNSEHSVLLEMDSLSDNWNSHNRGNDPSFMGSTSEHIILGQYKDRRIGQNSNQYTGTKADTGLPQKRYIWPILNGEEGRAVHSSTKQCKNKDRLGNREQKSDTTRGSALIHNTILSNKESIFDNTNNEEKNDESKRARDYYTGNDQINRNRHRKVEGVRKPENFRYADSIQQSIGTIKKLGKFTNQIKENLARIRKHGLQNLKTITKQHQSQDLDR